MLMRSFLPVSSSRFSIDALDKEEYMKKMLLAVFVVGMLVLSLSPSAKAASFLSITVGSTTIFCDNSSSAGVTACASSGFSTTLNNNAIQYGNPIAGVTSFQGYSISSIQLIGNQPGTPLLANSIDTKTAITNVSATNPLLVQFASNNFVQPLGSPLTLSASQSATFTNVAAGSTQAFTGYGNAANTLTITGVPAVTPSCVAPISGTSSCNSFAPTTTFARSGNFALAGSQLITLSTGNIASFSGTVAAAPIPEPSSVLLLGTGMIILAGRMLRRKK